MARRRPPRVATGYGAPRRRGRPPLPEALRWVAAQGPVPVLIHATSNPEEVRASQALLGPDAGARIEQCLAHEIRETVKLVVVDGTSALTRLVANTSLEARVTALVGTRLPLHMGASQRLLLAHSTTALWRRVLAQPLESRTTRTLTDPVRLRACLERLRRVESEQSHGEGIQGVGAAATVVRDADERVQAALVAVYIHAGKSTRELQSIRAAVESAARELSGWDRPGSDSKTGQAPLPRLSATPLAAPAR